MWTLLIQDLGHLISMTVKQYWLSEAMDVEMHKENKIKW